ncbi:MULTISPECIES: sulfotransferase family 2 domain-containing protein [unclassified Okeania]|uniref:sulfotransferase family 2 domain-containing protein n=1 Tax=unclassified Okeania TaxID=2634635 RepID=UPI0013BB72BD|nr:MULTISPECIES: sulfotransferase family 2 domain-containing protein [unclassified Okeania]NES76457.1 sulfotransferase family protein [Okeania sp. SIO1H4]NET12496.1 sulfotransferase family protein [Okeania sp. SIO1H6]NET22465.1 sulfotransferase family protein [Okeania sp. SIO1H5]NET95928.1 sulfotransferase family protein [Okeania sp. SIO1H2]
MISVEKNFLFVHVPKTGGNSIQTILKNYSEDIIINLAKHHDGVERFEVRNNKYNIKKHSTLNEYKSVLSPKQLKKMFKFATTRNPWDRCISFYFSPSRGVKEWNRNDFILFVNKVKPLHHYIKVEPFINKVARKLKMPININTGRLDRDIDFLIRFENLEEDFQRVCKNIDIPHITLPKYNKSERKHYSKYYDQELKEIVGKKFKEEIELVGYEFESISVLL